MKAKPDNNLPMPVLRKRAKEFFDQSLARAKELAKEESATPARLEVMLKIQSLPANVEKSENGWTSFTLRIEGGYLVEVCVRPRVWQRLETAAKEWSEWSAAIKGKVENLTDKGFRLTEVGVQVFNKSPAE